MALQPVSDGQITDEFARHHTLYDSFTRRYLTGDAVVSSYTHDFATVLNQYLTPSDISGYVHRIMG